MKRFVQAVGNILWLVPAVVLAFAAVPHFLDGLAVDAAIPAPVYMIAPGPMPKSAYEAAVTPLGRADPRDGDAAIARGEAALRSGARPLSQVPALSEGLTQEPASARGWTLLSEAWMPTDKRKAARALAQALLLAPNEYWLAGARVQDAALLWPYLDGDTRAQALDQTRALWEEPLLRSQIRPLLISPDGKHLLERAFPNQKNKIGDIHWWLSRERRR